MVLHTIQLELELDEASGIYTVTSPDVPGLVTEGRTPEEITSNVQEAIECLKEGWQKHGIDIPPALRSQENEKVKKAQMLVMA
jgi:predicted RNase H-like HicB family nuclease